MKTPSAVTAAITRRLNDTWAAAVTGDQTGWPLTVPLGRPSSRDLATGFPAVQRWAQDLRAWTAQHHIDLEWETRAVSGTRQSLPIRAHVPDITTAAATVGNGWPQRLRLASNRLFVLHAQFPHAATPAVVRACTAIGETDFGLLCHAAQWFSAHDATGLTARQVPVEGLHGKWLNQHRTLVTTLAGHATLGLVDRPTRIHFTYLDPAHLDAGGRRHDSLTLTDAATPAYEPAVVVITENKDTAVYFPAMRQAIAVEGGGNAGSGLLPRVPWIANARHVLYWGDIDARGYEILNTLRSNGIDATSILMDLDAFTTYERFGAMTEANGAFVPCRTRKPLPHLTATEYEVYSLLTDPNSVRVRRIEQERIPLHTARSAVLFVLAARTVNQIDAAPPPRER